MISTERHCRTHLSIVVYKRAIHYGFSHYFSLFSWYVYILVKYCFMLINIKYYLQYKVDGNLMARGRGKDH